MQGQQHSQRNNSTTRGWPWGTGPQNGSDYHFLLAGIAGSITPHLQANKVFLKAKSPQENLLAQSYCHNWWRIHQAPQLAFPTIELLRGGKYNNRQIKEHPLQNITGRWEEARFQLQVTGITLSLPFRTCRDNQTIFTLCSLYCFPPKDTEAL